jgi:hypothetical protein
VKNTDNIIKSWREYLVYQDKTLKQGVEEMNKTLGTKVMSHHVYEFEKASGANPLRKMKPEVYRYLVDEVFIFAIIQMQLKGLELQNLLTWKQLMSMPERKK